MRPAWLMLLVALPLRPLVAQDSTTVRPVRITYLTATSAYVDAGRDDGLHEGDSLHVRRNGSEVGLLRVTYLASRQASCDIISDPAALVVGDTLTSARAARPAAATTVAEAPVRRSPSSRAIRGRVGARYLGVWRRDGTGGHFTQPSLDLRVNGDRLGGSPIGLVLDLRARRTVSVASDGSAVSDGRTRAYQAALMLNPAGAPFRLTVGRQMSPSLASLTLLDGALAELNHPAWGVGLFAGSEPDPLTYDYSGQVGDFGGYVQLHSRRGALTQWSTTLGAVGSYEEGVANREFGYLQAAVSRPGFSLLAAQEVDYYRQWKQELGEPALSFSSSFANVRVSLSRALSLNGGVDNRRNVRLYRDTITPETAFDDTYRRGFWGGLALRVGTRGRVGFDARSSGSSSVDRTLSYTLSASAERLGGGNLGIRSRTTRYDGERESGWLQALTIGIAPTSALQLDLNGGFRLEQDPLADPTDVRVRWLGLDADLGVARGWFLMLSGTMERGGFESNDQLYTGLSYRF